MIKRVAFYAVLPALLILSALLIVTGCSEKRQGEGPAGTPENSGAASLHSVGYNVSFDLRGGNGAAPEMRTRENRLDEPYAA